MNIEQFFPTPVGFSKNTNHSKIKNKIIKACLDIKNKTNSGGNNWASKVYNTCRTYNIHENNSFKEINHYIFSEVNNFAHSLNFTGHKVACSSSWFNVYKKYDYQEYHDHQGEDISVVYFLKGSKKTGDLIFKSPEIPGVFSLFDPNNHLTFKHVRIKPEQGLLVLFKSNLIHCVDQNKTNETRMSLAYNFKVIQ
jgi:uncharacterized protein (TIGR02466 family)|tara:strand:- start:1045 stop:1629 length:585 start_codon:yes stop_codon:yes gene_type:complete